VPWLARCFGTPLYLMSANSVRCAIAEVRRAFAEFSPVICYAVKANSTLGLIRLVAREGCGVEVVSVGELFRALRAGVAPGRIVFSGAGKQERELEAGLRAGVLSFNVESVPELELLSLVARRTGKRARVALRINPHVDAHTHRYITTGTNENKFGIDWTVAERAYVLASRLPGIEVTGVHTHIGSQITEPGPFVAAVRRIDALLDRLARRGIRPQWRNLGGGMGVSYRPGQRRFDPAVLTRLIGPALKKRPMRLILEPGRFLVAEAGALVARVTYVKRGVRKTFAITDAGMDNLIRPCLYEAWHGVLPVKARRGRSARMDVVGPICESSDFLALGRRLPPLEAGDYLAVMTAGAYAREMSSNYNGRRRAAEVMVDGKKVHVLRRRESFEDLIKGE